MLNNSEQSGTTKHIRGPQMTAREIGMLGGSHGTIKEGIDVLFVKYLINFSVVMARYIVSYRISR